MYKFTEDCLTGIEQVDTEHEKLFELINQTMDLLHNDLLEDKYHQVREVMEELKSYADTSGSMTCLRSCWSIWCAGCIIIF